MVYVVVEIKLSTFMHYWQVHLSTSMWHAMSLFECPCSFNWCSHRMCSGRKFSKARSKS